MLRVLRLGFGVALVTLACACTSLLISEQAARPEHRSTRPTPRAGRSRLAIGALATDDRLAHRATGDRQPAHRRQASPNEMQIYKGARWAKSPTTMIEDALLRTLEDSGPDRGRGRAQGSGIDPDYKLVLDLRRFESDYAQASVPAATIEVSAKLMDARSQKVVASRTFLEATPAASTGCRTWWRRSSSRWPRLPAAWPAGR
jgi:ABC-type uncharacterized transport system auxiliary subunit